MVYGASSILEVVEKPLGGKLGLSPIAAVERSSAVSLEKLSTFHNVVWHHAILFHVVNDAAVTSFSKLLDDPLPRGLQNCWRRSKVLRNRAINRLISPFTIFMPTTLSSRIKQAKSASKDVAELTEKLNNSLNLNDDDEEKRAVAVPEAEDTPADEDEDDWEKLADKELEAPAEPAKKTAPAPLTSAILELYDFDTRIPMHQLVKDFTRIVDPAATMLFRPKMVGQSLMMTFNNPKHGNSHRMLF